MCGTVQYVGQYVFSLRDNKELLYFLDDRTPFVSKQQQGNSPCVDISPVVGPGFSCPKKNPSPPLLPRVNYPMAAKVSLREEVFLRGHPSVSMIISSCLLQGPGGLAYIVLPFYAFLGR